jgi:hypothetical protein
LKLVRYEHRRRLAQTAFAQRLRCDLKLSHACRTPVTHQSYRTTQCRCSHSGTALRVLPKCESPAIAVKQSCTAFRARLCHCPADLSFHVKVQWKGTTVIAPTSRECQRGHKFGRATPALRSCLCTSFAHDRNYKTPGITP